MSGISGLGRHLEESYGIEVTRLTPLEPWAPDGVQRVDRSGGVPWVARVSPGERSVDAAEGDAEILRYLEAHNYPAERCAHDKPVTVFDGRAVVVTELVAGTNARSDNSTDTIRRVGSLVGLLHSLPSAPGAVSRPAGGWHHVSINGGGRRADVDALLPTMDRAAAGLAADDVGLYQQLRDELEAVDGGEDLPHSLLTPPPPPEIREAAGAAATRQIDGSGGVEARRTRWLKNTSVTDGQGARYQVGWDDPSRWTIDVWADDIVRFCNALGIIKPIVFGQSFAGAVAVHGCVWKVEGGDERTDCHRSGDELQWRRPANW